MNNYNPILNQINQISNVSNNQQALNQLAPALRQAKNLLQQFKAGPNAQLNMNQYLMSNPLLRDVMNFVQNEHNGDAKEAFYAYARQKGIDPDAFISQLNN